MHSRSPATSSSFSSYPSPFLRPMFASKDAGESADAEGDHAAARVRIAVEVYRRTNSSVEEGECECGRVTTISSGKQCPKTTESQPSAAVSGGQAWRAYQWRTSRSACIPYATDTILWEGSMSNLAYSIEPID